MSGEVVARTRRQSDRHSRWRGRTLGQEPGECLEYDSQGPRWESRKSPRSETAALTESSTFDEQCGHAPLRAYWSSFRASADVGKSAAFGLARAEGRF